AGSDHHFLAVEHQLRPLLSFFRMHTVPGAVYAQNANFQDGQLADETVRNNCERLGQEVVRLWRATHGQSNAPSYPTILRKPAEASGSRAS
ncbi:MAG: reductase, partial [Thermomicrobiales bacterium]|nr:reductase [Thermomicrobiales bacterium]